MEKVFKIFIHTTPQLLREAITDPDTRARYHFGVRVQSNWLPGSTYQHIHPGAPTSLVDGENLEVDPPRRLVQTMRFTWDDNVRAEGTSRVTWEIEQFGDTCQPTVTHDQLREGADPHLHGGWTMVLSGLKTWLEPGHELTTPGSLMHGGNR